MYKDSNIASTFLPGSIVLNFIQSQSEQVIYLDKKRKFYHHINCSVPPAVQTVHLCTACVFSQTCLQSIVFLVMSPVRYFKTIFTPLYVLAEEYLSNI